MKFDLAFFPAKVSGRSHTEYKYAAEKIAAEFLEPARYAPRPAARLRHRASREERPIGHGHQERLQESDRNPGLENRFASWTIRENIIAAIWRRHVQRMSPRVELSISKCGKHAR